MYYGSAHTLQDVSFTLESGAVALVGRNGMGKTTLCNALMGLVPARSGSVAVNGQTLNGKKPHQRARQGVGYVPQGRRIFPSLTVHEHLAMLSQKGAAWTTERVYDLFPRLYERRGSGAGKLSGGEQQMLAVARALLLNARLLVMDEPSEGLAPVIVDQLVETLNALVEEDIGLLIVEQKLEVAAHLSNRILVMMNGRIVTETSASDLLTDEGAQRRYLGIG